MRQLVAIFGVLLVSTGVWAGDKKAVAVLDIQGTGIDEALLPTLTEILTVEIDALNMFKVIAGRDIQAMLGFEKQKDVLGCTDAACLAEIGGALGVERIVAGHIGKVGSTFVVNIKLINIRMANTEGRVYETVRGEVDAVIDTIRRSVGKLFDVKATVPVAKPQPQPQPQPQLQPQRQLELEPEPQPVHPVEKVARAPLRQAPKVDEHRGEHAADVTASPDSGAGVGVMPYVLWGVGGGAILLAVLQGAKAKSLEEEANDPSFVGAQLSADDAPKKAMVANVLWGVGLVSVGAGVLLALLSGDDMGDDGVAMAPVLAPDQVGFAVGGSF